MVTLAQTGVRLSSVIYRSDDSRMIPIPLPPALKLLANGGWGTSVNIPYGQDLQFTANKAGNITIALSDQAERESSIAIERNLLKKSVQNSIWASPAFSDAALDKDSATNMVTINWDSRKTASRCSPMGAG